MPEQTVSKPKQWLKPKAQGRVHFDEVSLRQLGQSMLVNGQQNPIGCLSDGGIIYGERRWRAAMLTDEIKEVQVRIFTDPLSAKQIRVLRATENLHRADLSGYEKWRECAGFLDDDPGISVKEMAELLKFDPSMITRLLSPSRCIPEAQEALEDGRIGISDCYAISLVPPEQQPELLQLKLSGASRDEIARQSRKRRNGSGSAPTVRVSRIRITLGSGVQVTVAGEDLDLENAGEWLAEARKQVREARDQNLDARTAQAVWRDRAKAAV
jgi:ParB family transcriptional regulator, chromosome partitioning protein